MDLFELATSYPFLRRAVDISSLKGNAPGPDGVRFYEKYQSRDAYERNIAALRKELRAGYRPGGLRPSELPSGRLLHIPNLDDRIIARAVGLALTPIFEPRFHKWSLGFRPGVSTHHAILELGLLCDENDRWVLRKIDVEKAFDRVPHAALLDIVGAEIGDDRLLQLIAGFVQRDGWKNLDGKHHVGIPMGDPLSPLAFNVYVNRVLDQKLARKHRDAIWLRWADDIILICRDRRQAEEHEHICRELLVPAGLTVNAGKSYTADLKAKEHIEYVGYDVSLGRDRTLKLHVPDGAYVKLAEQVLRVIAERRGRWLGDVAARGEAISRLVEFHLSGWLEAYAPAILEGEIRKVRATIREVFETVRTIVDSWPDAMEIGLLMENGLSLVKWPSGRTVKELWERGRGHWEARRMSTMPDVRSRLLIRQRTATVTIEQAPCHTGGILTDGSDLVPAPTARILSRPNRKLQRAYEEDWLVEPADSRAGLTGAEGPAMGPDPKPRRVLVTTDGGSRGNPGLAAAAYVMKKIDGTVISLGAELLPGPTTNVVAEYEGVVLGLEAAWEHGSKEVELRTDNHTVADQLNGIAATKHPRLRALRAQARAVVEQIKDLGGQVRVVAVRRAETQEADALVNAKLDEAQIQTQVQA